MKSWLRSAERNGGTIMWSCLACDGQPPGQYLDDPEGRRAHQQAAGHWPVKGRPLVAVSGVGT
jgi:hypothetical protein